MRKIEGKTSLAACLWAIVETPEKEDGPEGLKATGTRVFNI
jgi:hypothetical protein